MKTNHLGALVQRCPALSDCRADIERAFLAMCEGFRLGKKAFICGNGGSAADADHWAGELLKGFCSRRPLSDEDRARLPHQLGERLQGALPIIPLTVFPALSTAVINDMEPELVFAQLVWALGQPHDIFIGISTSGNARNVCAAAETARTKGLVTLALTGKHGGNLRRISDIAISVPENETYLVQEFHLPIYHCLSLMLEDEFFPTL